MVLLWVEYLDLFKELSFSNGNAGGRLLSSSSSDLRNSGEVMNETATVSKNVNLDGKLASSVHGHKNSMSIVRIGEGEIFGELSFLEGSTSSVTILADSNVVELLVMEGHMLVQLFEWKPELAARFFKYLATVIEKRLHLREKVLASYLTASSSMDNTGSSNTLGSSGYDSTSMSHEIVTMERVATDSPRTPRTDTGSKTIPLSESIVFSPI